MVDVPTAEIEPFGDDWYSQFTTFKYSAFRLELLQHYTDPGEAGSLRRFLAGEPFTPPAEGNWWWGELLPAARARGATVGRVHLVVEPLSDYVRFELTVQARSVAAGEDVRILPVTAGAEHNLDLPDHDFWLFDSRSLVILRFDTEGRLVAGDRTDDPAMIVEHNYWRDVALAQAIPYDAYVRGLDRR
jgi:hypothetical protein